MTAPAIIDFQTLHERLSSAAPPRVLDVRTPGEFDTAHNAGAYNVPLDLLREHRDEITNHLDRDVVLVCRSGQRAAQGFAVNRLARRRGLERQVRLVAGSIVLTSILASTAASKLKWVTAAIGGGLTLASLTNTCAMGTALSKLLYNRGTACDAQTVVAQLVGSPADQKASLRS